MTIEWRSIPGFPGYEVSNTGLVRSYKQGKPRILKANKHSAGYRQVGLRKNGKTYVSLIGHLVLLAFQGPCPEDCEMCHNDGNAINDHLDNLRWDTHAANMRDATRHGTMGRPKSKTPKIRIPTKRENLINRIKAIQAKMTDSISLGQRIKILRTIRGLNQGELAERIGMSQVNLSYIENDHVKPGSKRMLAILSELGWSEEMEPAFEILAGTRDGDEPLYD